MAKLEASLASVICETRVCVSACVCRGNTFFLRPLADRTAALFKIENQ